ncbi:membrane protein [Streptomyces hygroscopicus]|nr:membrane protein [Streptomyces hygroscopicus]
MLSAVLVGLACLLTPLGVLTAWAKYGIEDGARYAATTAPLASDAEVRDAVASAVTDGIMRTVHVGAPLQGSVHTFVHDAVRSFTGTEAFRTAWDTANLSAHDAVMRALHDGGDRPVTIDLAPATERMKRQLTDEHVPFATHIPVAHRKITLLQSEDLTKLRKGFHVLEVTGFWLPVASACFALTGILLSVCRRRAVLATGLGTALGAALLAIAIAVGRRITLEDLPAGVSHPAAGAVYDALTETLRMVSWVLLGVGLAVALGAWLTGLYVRRRRASAEPPPVPAEEPTQVRA